MIQHRSYDPSEYAAERLPGTWHTWVLWGGVVPADAGWMYLQSSALQEALPWSQGVQHVLTVAAGALWVKLWIAVQRARHGGR
jgi:hypothetical protein